MGNEMQEEKGYLQEAIRFAEQRMKDLEGKKVVLQKEITEQSKVMREELTQIIRDFDDIVKLSMENEVLTRAQQQYDNADKEYRRLQRLKESPYFARIDYVDQEFGEENRVYIGASGLSDAKSCQMYVCDWRAPVCELFYGFDMGQAWYETARGKVHVELCKKRQFKIEGGELKGMYDADSALYDDIFGEVLSGHTGPALKVIVESIQREQNKAIRFANTSNVLIYGPAGSGKTSVGMHRLAYLLYVQKDQLKSSDIVILSNNQVFGTYISGILPQLGEEEVPNMIFGELLDTLLPRKVTCEDFYSQYRVVGGLKKAQADERKQRIILKYSREMLSFVDKYFKEYSFAVPDVMFEDEVILTGEELNARMRRHMQDRQRKGIGETYRQSIDFLITTVKKLYENYFLEHKEQICQKLSDTITDEDGQKLDGAKLQLVYRMKRRAAVSGSLEKIRAENPKDALTHFLRILRLFSEKKGCAESMDEPVLADWLKGILSFEDALLYAVVGLYVGEIKPHWEVKHVLIDELQDYNPLQLYLIRLLYPDSAYTMLADSSQAVSTELSMQRYDLLEETWAMASDEPVEKLPLLKSYRSSAPINEFAFGWLKQFDPVCAEKYSYFMREGKPPVMIATEDPWEEVRRLLVELKDCPMVGIITADEADAELLYESLAAGEGHPATAERHPATGDAHPAAEEGHPTTESLQLLTEPQAQLNCGRIILPLILSKGLEFDAVILYRFRDRLQGQESYARKMYLGCTRALHELYLVDSDVV